MRGWLLPGQYGLLCVARQFLFLPAGINELMPSQTPRIKPLQKGIRVPRSLLRERYCRVARGTPTLRWNCLEHPIKMGMVGVKDLYKISVSIAAGQCENIGPRGQNLSRDLDRLTKSENGGLIQFTSMRSEFEKRCKSDDQANDDGGFIYFHLCLSR